jgi:hypothetical protein
MSKEIKKIAIIGASSQPAKYGNIVLKDLQAKGYRVVPVNPAQQEIEGLPVVQRIDELPDDIDLLVFVVPPSAGINMAKEAVKRGFTRLWFQPGAESDEIVAFLESQQSLQFSVRNCIMKTTNTQGDLLF